MTDADLLNQLLAEAGHSDCDKIKFGAAALYRGTVIGFGHNHNPRRSSGWSCAVHCAGGIRQGVRSGTCVERCYAIHAEQHVLLGTEGPVTEIAVAGLLPDGSLFDNGGGFYCTVCARLMAFAGVAWVSIWSKGVRVRLPIQRAWEQSYSLALSPDRTATVPAEKGEGLSR